MTLLHHSDDLVMIFTTIYKFISDFLQNILQKIQYALQSPTKTRPPNKKYNLSLATLISLALFRFFTGHNNWKDFYNHIKSYHKKDFPKLPCYKNFLDAMNKLSVFAVLLLNALMNFFKKSTKVKDLKLADSTKLEVCKLKREFRHKTCSRIASKSKSSMGWFYGFKLHIVCNELMQILNFRITAGNVDDRKGLEMMWNDIFGMIVADTGYVGKDFQKKAYDLGKQLLTGVRANMKKLMTNVQHKLLNRRPKVETVFSVLKLRQGLEATLPRSELGYFAHYIWCLAAYQIKKYFNLVFNKPLLA